jgi:hypothetical protein
MPALAFLSRFAFLPVLAILFGGTLPAQPTPVLHPQGSLHGFLSLSTKEGKNLATGDLMQSVSGARVTTRLLFKFLDGSVDDETTIFTQHGAFRLVSDHHIQKGPSFPNPIDVLVDATSGQVTSQSPDGKVRKDQFNLPPDLCNGLPTILLLNMTPSSAETRCAYIAPTAKPRLIHLNIKSTGEVTFLMGGAPRKATDWVLHPDIGGISGVIAPLIGKQPLDIHVWIVGGASPAFIREIGQLYQDGPLWRIEQISATFPN